MLKNGQGIKTQDLQGTPATQRDEDGDPHGKMGKGYGQLIERKPQKLICMKRKALSH